MADAVVLAAPSGGGRMPSFSVWVPWPSARSDAGGRFSITVWNDAAYALQAQAGGGVATTAGDDLPANDPAGGARSGEDGGFVIAAAPLGLAVVRCGGAIATVAEALAVITVGAGGNQLDVYVVRLRGQERPGNTGMRLSRHLAAPVVVAVRAGSSASTAGVLAGDRVVAVDGADVTALSPSGVDWLIGDRPQGTPVTVTFSRGGATRTLQLTVEPPWD